MKIDFEDITWEMYCEYLGIPVYEPFKQVEEHIEKETGIKQNIFNYLNYHPFYAQQMALEFTSTRAVKRQLYNDYFLCTMDKDYFLESGFNKYLINKNRLDLINKIIGE
jgi:hypothetical protein